jgi:Fe-S cluster assembly ATP-binding protein
VGGSLIIITHNDKILASLNVDRTHILADGKVAKEGDGQLAFDVLENGFEKYIGEV